MHGDGEWLVLDILQATAAFFTETSSYTRAARHRNYDNNNYMDYIRLVIFHLMEETGTVGPSDKTSNSGLVRNVKQIDIKVIFLREMWREF